MLKQETRIRVGLNRFRPEKEREIVVPMQRGHQDFSRYVLDWASREFPRLTVIGWVILDD